MSRFIYINGEEGVECQKVLTGNVRTVILKQQLSQNRTLVAKRIFISQNQNLVQ